MLNPVQDTDINTISAPNVRPKKQTPLGEPEEGASVIKLFEKTVSICGSLRGI